MTFSIVIPARYASQRLPGKPLAARRLRGHMQLLQPGGWPQPGGTPMSHPEM